jgi:hypothetical protein
MHDGHPHTLRSHRVEELEQLKTAGTWVGADICGVIVDVRRGSDGAPRAITIHDSFGNFYTLPGMTVLRPVDSEE